MENISFWALMTLFGTPEYWLYSVPVLLAAYFIFRYSIPENPSWKKARPVFRKFLVIFIPSLLLCLGLALILKTFWYVPRPCISCDIPITLMAPLKCNPYCPPDSSFPSGHAGAIFTVFSSLYISVRKRPILILFIIPVLVSASRVFLGVHTVIDVASGAFIGLIMPVLVTKIAQKWHKLK